MRAITDAIKQAKQLLTTVADFPNYTPFGETESIPELTRALVDIRANQQHYQSLLASYHDTVRKRRLLIDAETDSINCLLAQLDYDVLRILYKPYPDTYQRLNAALRYLIRQGLAECPADIMHPSRRLKHEHFKRSYASLIGRYTELIELFSAFIPIGYQAIFPLDEFVALYDQIRQLTNELDELEGQIKFHYEQQVVLHHEIKKRTAAIRSHHKRLTLLQQLQAQRQVPNPDGVSFDQREVMPFALPQQLPTRARL